MANPNKHGFGRRNPPSKLPLSAIAALVCAGAAYSPSAQAEPMDPAIERLVTNGGECLTDPKNDVAGAVPGGMIDGSRDFVACQPDDAAFKKLMNQWGWALAPTAMHSARTTGFGGFHLSLQLGIHKISDGEDYWKNGTQGPRDPSTNAASIVNSSPDPTLQIYSVKLRKSFGFGLETMGTVGFVGNTDIITGGADARLSLLEGFRTGAGGILPDLAVGAGVRTLTGTSQFQMTIAGLDFQISKPLPIADSQVITPYVGFQYLWIFGDSGLVDLTPATDPVGFCGYAGPNVPGNPDLGRSDKNPNPASPESHVYDGQPVCRNGSPLDFNNNVVFEQARLERQRLIVGLNYRYEMVMAGLQFITDVVAPADAQNDDKDKEILTGEERQWSIVMELGAMF